MSNCKKSSSFESEVLTRLEYIKENQAKHDKLFEEVYKQLNANEKEIDIAKGFAKGAMFIGGVGLFAGIAEWIEKLLFK